MRNYNTTDINSAAGAPLKSGTIDHLQLAYREIFNELAKTIIGTSYDATKTYRLYGAQISDPFGSDYYITSQGAIFYDGEIYLVDEVSGVGVYMGDHIGLTISTTQYTTNADPVVFSDTSTHNIHDIKKMRYFNDIPGNTSLPLPQQYSYDAPYGFGSFGGTYEPNSTLRLSWFEDPNPLNGATIKFTTDTLWRFPSSSVSSNTVYLDSTNGTPGCHVKLYAYGSPGVPVNFVGTASSGVIRTGATAIGSGANFIADIIYGIDNTFYIQCTN